MSASRKAKLVRSIKKYSFYAFYESGNSAKGEKLSDAMRIYIHLLDVAGKEMKRVVKRQRMKNRMRKVKREVTKRREKEGD